MAQIDFNKNAKQLSNEITTKEEAIEYLKSLPEFNAKIFTEITGIEV